MQKWYYSRDPVEHKKYTDVVALMQAAKMPDMNPKKGSPDFNTVMKNFQEVLIGSSYNPSLTPMEYLTMAATDQSLADPNAAAAGPKGPYMGPQSRTDLSTVFDAKALVNTALGQYLGRQATDSEIAKFHQMLNAQQTANPSVSDPTKAVDGTITDVTTSGGISEKAAGQIAEDYAKSQTDFAETQASTTGLSWLTDALRADKSGRMA
jgi:hypothetical protein